MIKNFLVSTFLSIFLVGTAHSAGLNPIEQINAGIDADKDRLLSIFKDIHQNPELAFNEKRTAAIMAKELKKLGYEVKTGIGGTGVVGILRNGNGPVLMYRADMDANPVEEAAGLPYASKVKGKLPDGTEVGVGHMCGHDAHVTWLLGMAKAMANSKAYWSGTLVLVGQPAEETVMGAKAMIADGMYTKHGVPVPDYFIGMHTAPGPVGVVANVSGVRMAGTELLDVTFHGVGGHGSVPQLTKDPVIMAAMAVVQYQMIISRILDPLDAAVLTVGSIQAGVENNVIPDTAVLKINLRYFKPEVRETMIIAINRINEGIARTYGIAEDKMPTMVIKGSSTPLVNSEILTNKLNAPLVALLGEKGVIKDMPPATGSEDVQLLLGDHIGTPFAYLLVGIADPEVFLKARKEGKTVPYTNHSPNFIVDLKSIPLGTKIAANSAFEILKNK